MWEGGNAMRVSLALLADYANVSREGKLNIMGIFDNINASSVPTAHAQMQLVLTVEGSAFEAGKDHPMEIELQAPTGDPVFKVNGTLHFGKAPSEAAVKANSTIQLNNLLFKQFGRYRFVITINGAVLAEIPFAVVEVKPQ
jgi:hypothetical protein